MRSNRQILMIAIIFGGILMQLVFWSASCGGDANVSEAVRIAAKAGSSVPTSTESQQRTDKGVSVFGKRSVSDVQLARIDEGIDRLIAAGRGDGFTSAMYHGFYDVFTPPYDCIPSPEQRVPSFLVRADNYDGTEYDQYNSKGVGKKDGTGVVFAAEMVLSLGTRDSSIERGQMYVCPDLSVVTDAVRHGADHIALANNIAAYEDGNAYFNCSLYHYDQGFGPIVHPLVPRNGRCSNASFRPDTVPIPTLVIDPVK